MCGYVYLYSYMTTGYMWIKLYVSAVWSYPLGLDNFLGSLQLNKMDSPFLDNY